MASAMPAVRATFKRPAQPFSPTHARPSSPEAPAFEPLSPPPRPIEPTFNYPALAQPTSRTQSSSKKTPQLPQNKRRHHPSPSIEALADAALSISPQPRPAAPATTTTHHKSSPEQHPNPDSTRASKRARSDAGPLPHPYPFSARPSSSHQPPDINAFPPTYNVDRHRRQSTNTTASMSTSPLEDAELLLNFASRVTPRPAVPETRPRPAVVETQPRPPALAPSALPPPPPPVPYPTFVAASTHSVHASASSTPPENPSASLPSPQGTNEDDKTLETEKEVVPALAPMYRAPDRAQPLATTVSEPHDIFAPQQTHTPPEEERLAPSDATAGPMEIDGIPESQVSQAEPQQAPEVPAARPRRGWPKGKPRGPRNKNSAASKLRSTARRSRASTAKSNPESGDSSIAEEKRARRKSESNLSFLSVAQSQSRSADSRALSVPPGLRYEILSSRPKSAPGRKLPKEVPAEIVCAGCNETRESNHGEMDQWIGCNGCKKWLHFDCAGFKNERDVRDVDKFFCKNCEPQFGPTTFVRKSSRAHAAVDYAGLNQGILKTSDDNPEHHYIQPIKDGTFTFDPETFPRMRPELVTRQFFETCASFSEPVVIPAAFNPKVPSPLVEPPVDAGDVVEPGFLGIREQDELIRNFEYETVPDDGQDRLDMVVPHGLTVRHVAELVGPNESLDVIDVKTQGTEGKWNLQKWADYYEADGEKAVRNVISLEVSATKLGRLLRRPKVVRDIDLQDSVWPEEETVKGNWPKVQFYCLMSVADSFTDFHIDFGGSSVYYHILRGKKTFFFIPPKPGHLKKYEDWNNSQEQNFSWLPDATKECYRVDLSEGDTMLIPSGWIHAVWTPENSLVIGGNFLTRMHYSTQFRIVDIEKAIKTPQKFRYPLFQKVMWYTLIKYLETDPLPADIAQIFYDGNQFSRERPVWQEFNQHDAEDNIPGTYNYNARYYSQAELDGLPELVKFIFRTVMICNGRVEGITEDTRKKVTKSIPKSHGEPLELAKTFALWVAWKRGNEDPPAWAHPDADLPDKESAAPKRLSARALKHMQRQEAFNAYRAAPDRQSARQQASREAHSVVAVSPAPSVQAPSSQTPNAQHTSTPKTSVLGPKRVACDACRKRRIKCKHKDVVTTSFSAAPPLLLSTSSLDGSDGLPLEAQRRGSCEPLANYGEDMFKTGEQSDQMVGIAPVAQMTSVDGSGPALVPGNALLADPNSKRGRSKACLDCRKSKRRCIHDENGKIDPVKAEQTPVPRGSTASKKRRNSGDLESPTKKVKQVRPMQSLSGLPFSMGATYQANMISPQQYKQAPYQEANIPHWHASSYMYPDPTDADGNIVVNGGPYHQHAEMNASYNAQSLEQLANDVLDSRYVNDGDYTVPQPVSEAAIHPALQQISAPSHEIVQAHQTSPLQEKPRPSTSGSTSLPNGVSGMIESTIMSSESQRRPSPSSEFIPAPKIDTLGHHVSHAPSLDTGVTLSPQTNGLRTAETEPEVSVMLSKQPTEITVNSHTSALRQQSKTSGLRDDAIGVHAGQPVGELNPRSEEAPVPLLPVSKADLHNIPLYEPPPPVINRQSSRTPRQATSVNPERSTGSSRRSLSKTPAPVQPAEQKTPASSKRKRESTSATPSTTKSKKIGHTPREESIVEDEEEKSIQLARELQDEEWGLRRRSGR